MSIIPKANWRSLEINSRASFQDRFVVFDVHSLKVLRSYFLHNRVIDHCYVDLVELEPSLQSRISEGIAGSG